MLAFTFGIPLSILAFLVIGSLVGTAATDPGTGIMPGFIAGCAVFGLCMFLQNKANHTLENPEAIVLDCSPETAFGTVYDTLLESHYGDSFWSIQPMQQSLKLVASIRFQEMICAGGGFEPASRFIRLVAQVGRNEDGKTTVTLRFFTQSPHGRWKCDEGIAKLTRSIKENLMLA